jgi:hypothetical protein
MAERTQADHVASDQMKHWLIFGCFWFLGTWWLREEGLGAWCLFYGAMVGLTIYLLGCVGHEVFDEVFDEAFRSNTNGCIEGARTAVNGQPLMQTRNHDAHTY